MKRIRRFDSSEDSDRWLLSYADFVTLLFAFFTVMYALSSMSEIKYMELSDSLSTAFAVGRDSESIDEGHYSGGLGNSPIISTFRKVFSEDFRTVQSALSVLEEDETLNVNLEARGVIVSIMDRNVFSSGSAKILPESYDFLDDIADMLVKMQNPIKIEGHTDNIPISTKEFPSNWELSSARALNILQYLVDEHGIEPSSISASGYAEFRPVSTNETPEGRGKNRRVDIIILNRDGSFVEPHSTEGLKPGASVQSEPPK